MKRKFFLICLFIICSIFLVSCGGKNKKVQKAYDEVRNMAFSDMSILSEAENARLSELIEQRDKAYNDKNINELENIKQEWEEFSTPINQFIQKYNSIKNSYFTDYEKKLLTNNELKAADDYINDIANAYKARDEEGLDLAYDKWLSFSKPLKDVFSVYNSVKKEPFSETEKKWLSDDKNKTSTMQEIMEKLERSLQERNLSGLKSTVSEWDTLVSDTKKDIDSKKEKMLQDWVNTANLTGGLTSLFSFGAITSTTMIDGHKIIYTTQYNTDMNMTDKQIKEAMDNYLEKTSIFFQSSVDTLKEYIEDVCIRIEYKNMKGTAISSKEFK